MNPRDSQDGRRRRSSYSSSHDPRTLIQRETTWPSHSSQHPRSPDVRHPTMPPPQPPFSASHSQPALAHHVRRRAPDIYVEEDEDEDEDDSELDYPRRHHRQRQRSPSETGSPCAGRQYRPSRRIPSPTPSEDLRPRRSRRRRTLGTASDSFTESSDELAPLERQERRMRREESYAASSSRGLELRTPSASSRDLAADRRSRSGGTSGSRQRPPIAIEAPPPPTPERYRVITEVVQSHAPMSSRRHTHRSDPVVIQEVASHRDPSRSRSHYSSYQQSCTLSSVVSGSTGRRHPSDKHLHKAKRNDKPTKIVTCIACMEETSSKRAPKLKCGHRMCHSCLKRTFELSLTDPQNMPPRCCSPDRISVRHVEHLFDTAFKKTWNRKYEEFTTRDRLYCPSKKCGEWIKPSRFQKEGNRTSARCSHCRTKVCVSCNGKWHSSFDCPKDEETQAFLRQAKEEGWQRCYSCKAMVERKQGCNHMTCRCSAQFCMICGSKWRSCDCEWFNFEEHDDLDDHHAERADPLGIYDADEEDGRYRVSGRTRPRTFSQEMHQRRRREKLDEDMARRMQYGMDIDEGEYSDDADEDEDGYDFTATRNGVPGSSKAAMASSSGEYMSRHRKHSNGNNGHRTRLSGSSTTAYDRRTVPRTPSRDDYEQDNYWAENGHSRSKRATSMERRLAERLDRRSGPVPLSPEMAPCMGYPPPGMTMGAGMPMTHPPMPMGAYAPVSIPMAMAPGGTPPMISPPPHHPFGVMPHGPPVPMMRHSHTMPVTGYAPIQGGSAPVYKRRDSTGSGPRSSSMAGLTGKGSGLGRVNEWRHFVEPLAPGSDSGRGSDERLSRA